jgi:hypothetical protein
MAGGAKIVLPLRRAHIFIFGRHIEGRRPSSEWRNTAIFQLLENLERGEAPVDAINQDIEAALVDVSCTKVYSESRFFRSAA